MAKTTKILLVISILALVVGLAFVTGVIDVRSTVALYVVLPAGAIFLGLFLIFRMLEKETALYDQEQHAHPAFQVNTVASKKHSNCNCSAHAHRTPAATR